MFRIFGVFDYVGDLTLQPKFQVIRLKKTVLHALYIYRRQKLICRTFPIAK